MFPIMSQSSENSEETSKKVSSTAEERSNEEEMTPSKKSSRQSSTSSKNRRRRPRQDPDRFLRPTPSAGFWPTDEPPSLELHGGWVYPVAHYEFIERGMSLSNRNGSKMRFGRRANNNESNKEIQSNFRPCLRQSRCCCCCCCCCRCPCNQKPMYFQNDRQPKGMVGEKRSSGPSRRKLSNVDKRNVSLFNVNTRSCPTKGNVLTPSEKNEEVEFEERKDMNLASIWVNHANEGFDKAVHESDKIAKDKKSARGS